MSWFVALRKFRLACVVMLVACCAFIVSACSRTAEDYTGSWMGIDDSGANVAVYQCDIMANANSKDLTIRMIQYRYDLTNNNKIAVWKATNPHYFNGTLNKDGDLISDIGLISAKPNSFQLLYGDIVMTRRAKNTEVKFKYLARQRLQAQYPELMFNE